MMREIKVDVELVKHYIDNRLKDLDSMIGIYRVENMQAPIDLLARKAELERFREQIEEYEYVESFGAD